MYKIKLKQRTIEFCVLNGEVELSRGFLAARRSLRIVLPIWWVAENDEALIILEFLTLIEGNRTVCDKFKAMKRAKNRKIQTTLNKKSILTIRKMK